jgi:hypothetical protein
VADPEPLRKARMHETMIESSTSLKSMVDAYERQLIQSALAAAAATSGGRRRLSVSSRRRCTRR